jgi:phage replication-related protein YjqB (UPF0714/DUF867 family)
MGADPMNICNRGKSKQALQLEISRRLRHLLRTSKRRFQTFVNAVRKGI